MTFCIPNLSTFFWVVVTFLTKWQGMEWQGNQPSPKKGPSQPSLLASSLPVCHVLLWCFVTRACEHDWLASLNPSRQTDVQFGLSSHVSSYMSCAMLSHNFMSHIDFSWTFLPSYVTLYSAVKTKYLSSFYYLDCDDVGGHMCRLRAKNHVDSWPLFKLLASV